MFLITLSCLLCLITATHCDLVFSAQPKAINVGVTRSVVLNCAVEDDPVLGASNITQLVLSRLDPATGTFDQLVTMTKSFPNGSALIEHTDNLKWIVKHGNTYVSLTVPDPTETDVTEYTCEAFGPMHEKTQEINLEVQLLKLYTTNVDNEESDLNKNMSDSSSPDESVKLCLQENSSNEKCQTSDPEHHKCDQRLTSKGVIRTSLDPDELTIGTTDDLHFMCVVPRQNSPDFLSWISIAISHSQRTDNPQFEDLLIIKRFEGETQKISFQQFRSDVNIESDGVAHVRISWRHPTLNRVGLYRCDVNGIDTWGRPLTVSSTSLLPASRHDVDSINLSIAKLRSMFVETIKKVKSEISDLKKSINENDCKSNCSEVSTSEISNLKEKLRQTIELVKQQEDLCIKLENDVNKSNRLISSELNNLKEITENLTAELSNKSRSESEMKCQEKCTNLTAGNEQALLRINEVNNNLTNEINELKIDQSNQYVDLRNSIQVCKADLRNASERFKTMIAELKTEHVDQKLVNRSLWSEVTNVKNLLNTLKINVGANTQNLSSLKFTLDRLQANYTQLNANPWETLQKSIRDKLEQQIKNAPSSLTQLVKDIEDFNRRAVSPKSLFKDELNRLFFGSSCLRYWLTKNTYTHFSAADAQSMCVRFGGYLAEIDSDIEFEIIKRFVIRHKSRGTVSIGGTDSLSEGTRVKQHRLMPVAPHWSSRPKRPTNIKEDCQCLIHYYTWEPKDCSCYFNNLSNAGFLCEIPE